jgi:hypothetical protein
MEDVSFYSGRPFNNKVKITNIIHCGTTLVAYLFHSLYILFNVTILHVSFSTSLPVYFSLFTVSNQSEHLNLQTV